MKFNFTILFVFLYGQSSAWSVTAEDIQMIKSSEAYYELDESGMTKAQKKMCVEGRLALNSDSGDLLLGGSVIALGLKTEPNSPNNEAIDCQDSIKNKIEDKSLWYSNSYSCKKEKIKMKTQRVISFKPNAFQYTQEIEINGKKANVMCKFNKEKVDPNKKPWTVESPVIVIPDSETPKSE